MPNYRPIKTDLWDDDYIYELDSEEKLLFVFLITNSKVNLCGIYRISLPYIYRMTTVSKDKIQSTLKRFEKDDKMKIIGKEWISIKNFVKHHTASPKITEGLKREIADIPQEIRETAYPIHRVGINLTKLNYTIPNLTKPNTIKKGFKKKQCPHNRCQPIKGECEVWCQHAKQ